MNPYIRVVGFHEAEQPFQHFDAFRFRFFGSLEKQDCLIGRGRILRCTAFGERKHLPQLAQRFRDNGKKRGGLGRFGTYSALHDVVAIPPSEKLLQEFDGKFPCIGNYAGVLRIAEFIGATTLHSLNPGIVSLEPLQPQRGALLDIIVQRNTDSFPGNLCFGAGQSIIDVGHSY